MRRFFAKKGSGAYPIIKPAVRLRAVTFFLEGAGRKRASSAAPYQPLIIDREAPPKWRDLSERKWSSALTQTNLP
jgi:hypothetical protein